MSIFKKKNKPIDVYVVLYRCPRRITKPDEYIRDISDAVETEVKGVYRTYRDAVQYIKRHEGLEYWGSNAWRSDWKKLPGATNQEYYELYWYEQWTM